LILAASVFVVAACGLVYELVLGAVSSYLLGDAVTQFSLVIGIFLCAMGLGSYLAQYVEKRLLPVFVEVEIVIGLLGGLSSLAMFTVGAFLPDLFVPFFYGLTATLGALVGIEIPLLVRLLRRDRPLKEALSHVLALDYVGALAGAVLFPLLVLPFLGLSRASVVFGLLNLLVAAMGVGLLERRRGWTMAQVGMAAALLLLALGFSGRLVGFLEDQLYQDRVIYARSTPYQRIVITRWHDDVRLFLDGQIQFSSVDEFRYHEALVIPAMEAAVDVRRVLVLGGGDGMAVREVLKYPRVVAVTLVDLDPAMTELGRERDELVRLNQGALRDPRVRIVNDDAMRFLERDRGAYDVVVVDLPDPHSLGLARLYSTAFYALAAHRLSRDGVLVTQATSPFYAPDAFWCVVRTMAAAIPAGDLQPLRPVAYHVDVPSFGDWGFVLAATRALAPERLSPSVPTRFLTPESFRALFAFGKDVAPRAGPVNRLDDPVLYDAYRRGWQRFNE
jgi:spermidine synthase